MIHPQANEETKAEADAALAKAGQVSAWGERITLGTVMRMISLFLFGFAAVLRSTRMRSVITSVSTVVMVIATGVAVLAVTTPVA